MKKIPGLLALTLMSGVAGCKEKASSSTEFKEMAPNSVTAPPVADPNSPPPTKDSASAPAGPQEGPSEAPTK